MPNHVHIILAIDNPMIVTGSVGAYDRAPLHELNDKRRERSSPSKLRRNPRTLGSLVAGLKSVVAKRINLARQQAGAPVWQRNYYERVIRNGAELNKIREYVKSNPLRSAQKSRGARPCAPT